MIELPEAINLSRQIENRLKNKVITKVFNATYEHKFTFFHGDESKYNELLQGRKILSAKGKGIFVSIQLENNIQIAVNDGVNIRLGNKESAIPEKYQLLITFDDETFLAFTVAMYAGIAVFQNNWDNIYYQKSNNKISPLSNDFDKEYFESLIIQEKKNISVKALLATEQRIPGLGNGVLHDILFNAKLHPKRKIFSLSENEKEKLFLSVKRTLADMTNHGGRNTEKDLFGNQCGYEVILSQKTYKAPCRVCKSSIAKENYMGGSIYYCPSCQKL